MGEEDSDTNLYITSKRKLIGIGNGRENIKCRSTEGYSRSFKGM